MQITIRLSEFVTGHLTDFREIVCLIGDGNYTCIHFQNGKTVISSKNISLFEQLLISSPDFVRIHKRHIVNVHYVSSITKARSGRFVSLHDGRKLAIARRRSRMMMQIQLYDNVQLKNSPTNTQPFNLLNP